MVTHCQSGRAANEAIRHFEDWLREAGARMPSVEIRLAGETSRAICARTALRTGQAMLEVPLKCIITTKVAQASVLSQNIVASGFSFQSFLASFLLEQKRMQGSWWASYIGVLPATFPNSPLSFTGRELDPLKGSLTLEMVEAFRQRIREDYQLLCERVCGFCQFSYLDYEWACQVVESRVFVFEADGQQMRGLVPLADLLDHKMPRETLWGFDSSAHVFRVNALRDFRADDKVYDSYGCKSNSRFFVHYGFVVPDNNSNEAVINLPFPSAHHRYYNLLAALGKPSAQGVYGFRVPIDAHTIERVLSYLRLLCIAGNEDATIRHGSAHSSVRPISRRNEVAALTVLLEACRVALCAFETTLAEDDALLQNPHLTTNQRNSLIVCRGEKRILHHYRDMAEAVIPLLRSCPSPFARMTELPSARFRPFLPYVSTIQTTLIS